MDTQDSDGAEQRDIRISGHLLIILDTILREQSVTRAAVKLNMSQSNTSAALARLRQLFNDPLLVRGKIRMVPTERGMQLARSLGIVIETLDILTARTSGLTKELVPRRCVVGCVGELSHFLTPQITAEIRESSAATTIDVRSVDSPEEVFQKLEQDEVDIAIVSQLPKIHLSSELVAEDQMVCMMSKTHDLAQFDQLTVDQYRACDHVALRLSRKNQTDNITEALKSVGTNRKVAVAIPYIEVIPHAVAASDLIFTTSRRFAEFHARFLPLHIAVLDFELPSIKHYQVWNPSTRDPVRLDWIMSKIRSACSVLHNYTGACA